jgi:hypothetical protein
MCFKITTQDFPKVLGLHYGIEILKKIIARVAISVAPAILKE